MNAPQSRPSPVDVLLVEDDPDLRQELRLILENQGYRCAEAATGAEALEIAWRVQPRLALLDAMMPDGDGFTTAQALRTDSRTRGVHLQMLTGRNDPDARRRAQRAGCEVFLTKPVQIEDLLETISLALTS